MLLATRTRSDSKVDKALLHTASPAKHADQHMHMSGRVPWWGSSAMSHLEGPTNSLAVLLHAKSGPQSLLLAQSRKHAGLASCQPFTGTGAAWLKSQRIVQHREWSSKHDEQPQGRIGELTPRCLASSLRSRAWRWLSSKLVSDLAFSDLCRQGQTYNSAQHGQVWRHETCAPGQ